METARTGLFVVSPISISAAVAVVVLVGSVAWNLSSKNEVSASNSINNTANTNSTSDANNLIDSLSADQAATSSSQFGPLGTSILSQAVLTYDAAMKTSSSTEAANAAVQKMGERIKPQVDFTTYAASDIKTDPDTSKDRVLSYRADLRKALEPLLDNKSLELDLFAQYVDTKDSKYLDALRAAAVNYRLAIANTLKVVAPVDAAIYQASILNAMGEFAATLDAMVDNATDPIASAALLKTYMGAQDDMLASFNGVGAYAANKLL